MHDRGGDTPTATTTEHRVALTAGAAPLGPCRPDTIRRVPLSADAVIACLWGHGTTRLPPVLSRNDESPAICRAFGK